MVKLAPKLLTSTNNTDSMVKWKQAKSWLSSAVKILCQRYSKVCMDKEMMHVKFHLNLSIFGRVMALCSLTLTVSWSISPLQLSKYFFRSWSQYSNTSVNFLSLCNTSCNLERKKSLYTLRGSLKGFYLLLYWRVLRTHVAFPPPMYTTSI